MTPGTGMWKYGIRFLYRIDSQGHVGGDAATPGKGEIGDKISPEPHMVVMSFCCMIERVNVVMNECRLYL